MKLWFRLLSGPLRIFFYLLYQPFASVYDLVATIVSVGLWKEWVMVVLPYLKGAHILELGHGPGHLQLALHQQGFQTIGLDRSPQMGHLTKKRLIHQSYRPLLVNGKAQNLPFLAECFQQVVATFPTDYIIAPDTLAEIRRVLTPDGELVVLPTAWITGKSALHRAARGLFRITGQAPSFDKARFERALEPVRQAGFSVISETINLTNSTLLIVRAVCNISV